MHNKENTIALRAFRKLLTTSRTKEIPMIETAINVFYISDKVVHRSLNNCHTHYFVLHNNTISKYGTNSNNTYLTFDTVEIAQAAWDELLQGLIVNINQESHHAH